jgi:hypothetical protein
MENKLTVEYMAPLSGYDKTAAGPVFPERVEIGSF